MLSTRLVPIAILIGLLLVAPATPSETIHAVSKQACYFGLLVGPEPGRLVVGFVDESKGTGTGFDVFALDLDGDGSLERRGALGIQELDEDWICHEFAFRDGDSEYRVEFDGLGPGALRTVGVGWTISRGDHSAIFINGRAVLSNSPLVAAFLPRIRLGGPYRFDLTTGQRGPDPIVNVALRDTMGCTLRLAVSGPEEKWITLALRRSGNAVLEATAEYG